MMPMVQNQESEDAQHDIDIVLEESDGSPSREWDTLRPLTDVYTHSEDEDGGWLRNSIGGLPDSTTNYRASFASAYATPDGRITPLPPASEPLHQIYHPSVVEGSDYSDSDNSSTSDGDSQSRHYAPGDTSKSGRSPPRTERTQTRTERYLAATEVALSRKPETLSASMTGRSHEERSSRIRRFVNLHTQKKVRPSRRHNAWENPEVSTMRLVLTDVT
ncbi:hypothetical protein PYCCODRAFT_1042690 [Trametes coccinea BRFM310]|uniref:Uncharacterized protein n=1 Tax=Trametes coccinea (strain BRFM310) TaxID=1353009 RepID=A0A1Y2IA88_TRAC3|nr:hypothetical protein PYCCODRAFT_1042690 [Trametes coccinea BRFM310]